MFEVNWKEISKQVKFLANVQVRCHCGDIPIPGISKGLEIEPVLQTEWPKQQTLVSQLWGLEA